MAFVVADDVMDATITEGTGSIAVSGTAPASFQTFLAGIGNGNATCFAIRSGSDLEVVIGTLTSNTTLSRDTVLFSTNGGAKVNWGPGSKDVYCTTSAKLMVMLSAILAGAGDAGKLVKVNAAGTGFDLAAQGTGGGTDADKLDGQHGSYYNPITTRGDLIVGDATPKPSRFALGSSGSFLKAGATDPAWAPLAASDIASGTLAAARLPLATTSAVGAVEKATQAETNAGTADKYPDAAGLMGALYESAPIAIVLGSNGVVTHGLGVSAAEFEVLAVCVTAQNGYTTGQRIEIPLGASGASYGIGLYNVSATQVGWVVSNSSVSLVNVSSGALTAITPANFQFIIQAKPY